MLFLGGGLTAFMKGDWPKLNKPDRNGSPDFLSGLQWIAGLTLTGAQALLF